MGASLDPSPACTCHPGMKSFLTTLMWGEDCGDTLRWTAAFARQTEHDVWEEEEGRASGSIERTVRQSDDFGSGRPMRKDFLQSTG